MRLTHVSFVFERKLTVITSAVKMSSSLTVERTVWCPTFFRGSKSLKSFLYYG